jgi:hypothetical protein
MKQATIGDALIFMTKMAIDSLVAVAIAALAASI